MYSLIKTILCFIFLIFGVTISLAVNNEQENSVFKTPKNKNIKTISLGRGEIMSFIWIEPMKMWIGQFEVTNGQYQRYDAEHDSGVFHGYRLNDRNQPVVNISWEEARNYCLWLNRYFSDQIPNDYKFRLPTEKEWEIFATCGDKRIFPWGDQWPPPDEWNYRGETGARGIFRFFGSKNFIRGHRNKFIVSAPVYESGTNEWQLYGVGGNVWEWCEDIFETDKSREEILRVIRGASWSNFQKNDLTITNKVPGPPQGKTHIIGFRVVIGP